MSVDAFGVMEGIGCKSANKKALMCQNFINKVSQMDGCQLAHFMDEPTMNLDGFVLELHFRIPPNTEFLKGFFRETKHEGGYVPGKI